MATAVAYGSITLVDLTDTGEFSVQPMSDLPLSVIYDPDQDSFVPNWGTSNLTITPAVYYAGESLTLGSTGLNVSWERQEGVAGRTGLITGETIVDSGKLKVTANKFTSSSTMITYIVTATYLEPTSQQTLTAQGQITFTLVKNASTAETATITGESVFKYDTTQTLIGASSITLTGKINNVSITEWQYQNSSGTWTKYPGSGTGTTLTVNATDDTFVNDKCIIRLMTSNNTVYDLHTITKLRDGAAGTEVVSAVLTNDDQMIPFSASGTGDYSSAISQIMIYEGGTNVTELWTITQSYDNVVATKSKSSGTHGSANDTTTVTNLSASTGNVIFTCTRSGYNTITKTFSLVKVESGADGVTPTVYSVEADNYALNKSISTPPVFTPANVTFRAYSQTGGNTKLSYAGRFKIFENITYAEYIAASPKPNAVYTSTSNESSYAYTPSTSATKILCILFEAGATTKILDAQGVVITEDGQTGAQGPQGDDGESAVNIILGNYADVLTCTNSNKIASAQTISIPFYGYEGTSRIACTATSVTLLGVTPTITQSTASADGLIQWVLPAGTDVSAASGSLSLQFRAHSSNGDVPVVENYSWSRNKAAKDGVNSVMLQIFTPNGANVVSDKVTSVTLQGQLTDGATDVTSQSGVTWQWAKYKNSQYTDVSGATTSSLVVQAADVDSYASYRLTANYNSKDYVAYFSVFDHTDPIQVTVLCSIGDQILNGLGAGAIYAKVSRSGEEIDRMKSERFLTAEPSSAKSGDYYYHVDETVKSITLMKYDGSAWQPASSSESSYTGTYNWSWRNKDGEPIGSVGGNLLPSGGLGAKIIYIDGDMIDKKIIVDVEVVI